MIHCLVIDDEPYARELLTEFIAKHPGLKLEGAFSSALTALPVLSKKSIDVIFLDIQMPDLTGIDFLKSLDKRPGVIFTTAFAEYAIEGFELDVIDYLLKPFDFQRFLKSVNKLTQRLEKPLPQVVEKSVSSSAFMFVKDGTKLVKIKYAEILFIKGTREYVTIHTRDNKVMSLQTLKNLEVELPMSFIRIHNSFIINLPAVKTISKDEVEIEGEYLPIGITYKKNFLDCIKDYFPGKELHL